ncbi:MAG: ATP-binding protein [Candidatus Methanodesulfokora sp.]|nr:MAG: ATPase [Candidatus Korarchaeota archaeon]
MDLSTYMVTKKESIRDIEVKPRMIEVNENKNFIISVIGPRRAGKTYFLYDLMRRRGLSDESYLFLNFEEPVDVRSLDEAVTAHYEIYGSEPVYVFLDEIQAFPGWEKHVYSLYERKRHFIFLTGSSSKLLAREIATQLRGRSLPTYVYPFSFKEILRISGIAEEKLYSLYAESKMRHLLQTCLRKGFFPDIVLGNSEPHKFFREYLDLVIYKDIIERFGLRNRHALEYFIESCISSNASTFSVHKVYNSLKSQGIKVSKKTLYNFQRILEDVSFGIFLRKYERSRRKIELSMPKFYLIDNGIYTYFEGENLGRLMENIVLLELLKAGFMPNREVFYWKSLRGEEVDFVLETSTGLKLIQATYASGRDEVNKREIYSLVKAAKALGTKNLEVVTWQLEESLEIDGEKIFFKPLWKWILSLSSPLKH